MRTMEPTSRLLLALSALSFVASMAVFVWYAIALANAEYGLPGVGFVLLCLSLAFFSLHLWVAAKMYEWQARYL